MRIREFSRRRKNESVRKLKHFAHAGEDCVCCDKEKLTMKKINVPYQEPHIPVFIDEARNATPNRNKAKSTQRPWKKKWERN